MNGKVAASSSSASSRLVRARTQLQRPWRHVRPHPPPRADKANESMRESPPHVQHFLEAKAEANHSPRVASSLNHLDEDAPKVNLACRCLA